VSLVVGATLSARGKEKAWEGERGCYEDGLEVTERRDEDDGRDERRRDENDDSSSAGVEGRSQRNGYAPRRIRVQSFDEHEDDEEAEVGHGRRPPSSSSSNRIQPAVVDWSLVASGGLFSLAAAILMAFREHMPNTSNSSHGSAAVANSTSTAAGQQDDGGGGDYLYVHLAMGHECQASFVLCVIGYVTSSAAIVGAISMALFNAWMRTRRRTELEGKRQAAVRANGSGSNGTTVTPPPPPAPAPRIRCNPWILCSCLPRWRRFTRLSTQETSGQSSSPDAYPQLQLQPSSTTPSSASSSLSSASTGMANGHRPHSSLFTLADPDADDNPAHDADGEEEDEEMYEEEDGDVVHFSTSNASHHSHPHHLATPSDDVSIAASATVEEHDRIGVSVEMTSSSTSATAPHIDARLHAIEQEVQLVYRGDDGMDGMGEL